MVARNTTDAGHRPGSICLLAALILIALSRSPMAGALHVASPAMLTPLGVIIGLVIAFLAARVWANVDHAQAFVAEEASGIRRALLISNVLPPETRDPVRKQIGDYLRFIDQTDWPAMLHGQARLRRSPPGLPDALTTLLLFVPQQPGQRVAQTRAVAAIEQVLQARRNRILLSETAISPPQRIVIIVLD